MANDRTLMAKKLLGALIIVSFFLVVTAYGEVVAYSVPGNSPQESTPQSPSGGSLFVSTAGASESGKSLGANAGNINIGNGNAGSSRPDGAGAGKVVMNTGGSTVNTSASGSAADQVIPTHLDLDGTKVTSTGTTEGITIDTQVAKEANQTVSVKETAVNVVKGPVTLMITTAEVPDVQDGTITAIIKSISMSYAPVNAQFAGAGTVSASFTADLMHLPPQNATIAASLAEKPSPFVQAAYDLAVTGDGYQMDAIAYTLNVAKTNLDDGTEIGTATVNMSISPSWIAAHGGVSQVKILRYADDGTYQVLDTRFVGLDSSGNMVFTGISPGGL